MDNTPVDLDSRQHAAIAGARGIEMKVGMDSTALTALCVVLFSGCTLFSPIKIDTAKYLLDNVPLDLPSETTHSATLLVLVPEATPVYATTQMAYTTQAYQVAYLTKNEWAETPTQMIQPLIVTALRAFFGAIPE